MKQAAGILVYRIKEKAIEVLLVHPGGPYNIHKDMGAWSIPKGEFDNDEEAIVAAKREFFEELGTEIFTNEFMKIESIKQKSGKVVYAWAAEGDLDVSKIISNTCEIEYPYKSGKIIEIPEVDRAEWFKTEDAKLKINSAQVGFIEELMECLK